MDSIVQAEQQMPNVVIFSQNSDSIVWWRAQC